MFQEKLKTEKGSSSESRDAKVMAVFAKIYFTLQWDPRKGVRKKLKGQGQQESCAKV